MSKKTIPTEEQVKKAQESLNLLATRGDAPLTFEECFDILEAADPTMMQDLTAEYFSFEGKKDQPQHFAFMGMSEITIKGKPVTVAKVRDRSGNNYLIGDKVFVQAVSRIDTALPVFLTVTYTGDKKSDAGTYRDFQVRTFPGS